MAGKGFGRPASQRHVLTAADRAKAHSPQALSKRRETFVRYREQEREAVRYLRSQGMVPAAIADELGLSDRTVRRHLAGRTA